MIITIDNTEREALINAINCSHLPDKEYHQKVLKQLKEQPC